MLPHRKPADGFPVLPHARSRNLDLTIISTYRCNSRCQMCYIWKNPTVPREEVSLETLSKLPGGFDNLNVSGGEPTLRRDLAELIDVVYPKARITEISSNGLRPKRLIPIIKKYPNIKVRFSVEGDATTSNAIRGEKNGFETKLEGLKKLREAGGTDLGFAIVIQDENADQLVKVYEMARAEGVELATSTLHNAWQFYKNDNHFYDRSKVAHEVEGLITALLRTQSPKNWFRGYLNLGLIEKILGHDRLIPCTAGSDFAFIDPWSDVWACNVRSDLPLGNLEKQSSEDIIGSDKAKESVRKVKACEQNCWMVTTARTAMRSKLAPQLPKKGPLAWVIKNKLKVLLGGSVDFKSHIDYDHVQPSPVVPRHSYLNDKVKDQIQLQKGLETVEKRYPLIKFVNL
jgi:MoaA/NifB/PqqE/SkfB family radical SAM enzyme